MINLPGKKQVKTTTNSQNEILPTHKGLFEKNTATFAVVGTVALIVIIAAALYLVVSGKLANPEEPTNTVQTAPSPFKNLVVTKPTGETPVIEIDETASKETELKVGFKVTLGADWQSFVAEDTDSHGIINFIIPKTGSQTTESTSSQPELTPDYQGEIEAYTSDYAYDPNSTTLEIKNEQFEVKEVGGVNIMTKKISLLGGNYAFAGEWSMNGKTLLIRIIAPTPEQAESVFYAVGNTVALVAEEPATETGSEEIPTPETE